MREMSVEATVILSAQEFNQYVLDNWEWSRLASYANQSYALGKSFPEQRNDGTTKTTKKALTTSRSIVLLALRQAGSPSRRIDRRS
jgi:hypothetical protein